MNRPQVAYFLSGVLAYFPSGAPSLPGALRTDSGREFCSRALLTWAYDRGVALRLIEAGKPNQNAYIESFNGRFREECLRARSSLPPTVNFRGEAYEIADLPSRTPAMRRKVIIGHQFVSPDCARLTPTNNVNQRK